MKQKIRQRVKFSNLVWLETISHPVHYILKKEHANTACKLMDDATNCIYSGKKL